jgi:hypothetical protein
MDVSSAAFADTTGYMRIFGGGPIYKNANNITELKQSGFTEVILWSVEVKANGDLNLNGEFRLFPTVLMSATRRIPASCPTLPR